MYVRKLKSNSGKIYAQIISMTSGKYRVVKNIGSSYSNSEIKRLEEKARMWIDNKLGVQRFDFEGLGQQTERFMNYITGLKLVGLDLLLGKIFDEIGFSKITDAIFRHLVISRLFYPTM